MLKQRLSGNEDGFTLVEILVVVLIIGILSAIAIPVFLNQRQKALESSLISDTKSAALAVETYYASGKKMSDLSATAGTDSLIFHGAPGAPTAWNTKFPAYSVTTSSGNALGFRIVPPGTETSSWRVHKEGDFCIASTNPNSKLYAYPGGAPLRYAEILYYDTALGGIVDFRAIVDAYKNNRPTACSGYAGVYINAGGV